MTIFLSDWTNRAQVLIPVVAVGMSLMIPIVAIIVDHFQKKAKMQLVAKAIEHGVDISGLDLDDESKPGPPMPYRAGMITFAVGIALFLVAKFALATIEFFHMLAMIGGAVCICVGLALLINDWMNRDRFKQPQEPGTRGPGDLSR